MTVRWKDEAWNAIKLKTVIKTAKKPTDTNIVTNFFPKFFLFFMFIFLLSAKSTNALCFITFSCP